MDIKLNSNDFATFEVKPELWELTHIDYTTGEVRLELKLFGKKLKVIEATLELDEDFYKLEKGAFYECKFKDKTDTV